MKKTLLNILLAGYLGIGSLTLNNCKPEEISEWEKPTSEEINEEPTDLGGNPGQVTTEDGTSKIDQRPRCFTSTTDYDGEAMFDNGTIRVTDKNGNPIKDVEVKYEDGFGVDFILIEDRKERFLPYLSYNNLIKDGDEFRLCDRQDGNICVNQTISKDDSELYIKRFFDGLYNHEWGIGKMEYRWTDSGTKITKCPYIIKYNQEEIKLMTAAPPYYLPGNEYERWDLYSTETEFCGKKIQLLGRIRSNVPTLDVEVYKDEERVNEDVEDEEVIKIEAIDKGNYLENFELFLPPTAFAAMGSCKVLELFKDPTKGIKEVKINNKKVNAPDFVIEDIIPNFGGGCDGDLASKRYSALVNVNEKVNEIKVIDEAGNETIEYK